MCDAQSSINIRAEAQCKCWYSSCHVKELDVLKKHQARLTYGMSDVSVWDITVNEGKLLEG